MTHEELYALWKRAEDAKKVLSDAAHAASVAAGRLELDLYEAEGRGHLAHAEWLRIWLGDKEGSCAAVLGSPEYREENYAGADTHAPPMREVA